MTIQQQVTTDPESKDDAERKIAKVTADVERIVHDCGLAALKDKNPLIQAMTMARGMNALRNLFTEGAIKTHFLPLQGTKLGFLTDKDKEGGYDWQTVRDVLVEALLRGFRPINNEFNIIASGFYGAKNGFKRIVREWPGISGFEFELAVPVLSGDKGACVAFWAKWRLDGKDMELLGVPAETGNARSMDTRIPVKVNSGMGADAILGKAERKMYARVFEKITGIDVIDVDGDEAPPKELPAVAEPAQDGKRISLRASKKQEPAGPPASEDPRAQEEPGANG
jgi:hypothetical protein